MTYVQGKALHCTVLLYTRSMYAITVCYVIKVIDSLFLSLQHTDILQTIIVHKA